MLILNSTSFVSIEVKRQWRRRVKGRKDVKVKTHHLKVGACFRTQIKFSSLWIRRVRKKVEKDFSVRSGSEANTFPTVFLNETSKKKTIHGWEACLLLLHGVCYRSEMMNEFRRLWTERLIISEQVRWKMESSNAEKLSKNVTGQFSKRKKKWAPNNRLNI